MKILQYFVAVVIATYLPFGAVSAAELPAVKVGVLKFGTVNWEMDVIQRLGLDRRYGFALEVLPLASSNATRIAFQGKSVDLIVGDWIWVARQNKESAKGYRFVPYSRTVGALVTRPDAGIKSLADLEGKRIGVAGGPVDKSWLLLRAHGKGVLGGRDLKDMVKVQYGAPPLLNKQVETGELAGVLNFWHYAARLEAAGMQRLIGVEDLLQTMGVKEPVPMLGWIYNAADWRGRDASRQGFFCASYAAKQHLLRSDAEWEGPLSPRLKAADKKTRDYLRDAYRGGIPRFPVPDQVVRDIGRLFSILAEQGGEKLMGTVKRFDPEIIGDIAPSACKTLQH